jgi:hypothetical protein
MRHIAAEFVPCQLNDDQIQNKLSLCKDLYDQARKDRNFIWKVITGVES